MESAVEKSSSSVINSLLVKKIDKLYDKLTYFDLYGPDIIGFVLLTLFVYLICAFCFTMSQTAIIQKDWVNQRCKPTVIPFAGLINKPASSTILDYTRDNFSYCVQGIMSKASEYAIEPIVYSTHAITEVYNDIVKAIHAIRGIISNMRDSIKNIVTEIMNRLMSVIIPIQVMLMSLMDGLGKINGVMSVSLMTALGSYLTLKALMGAILEFIVNILVALAILIVALWAGFFTWPVAAATTVMFLAISIPLMVIIVVMTQIMNIHTDAIPSLPSKPSCFFPDTQIVMDDGTTKAIVDIQVGDILENKNRVKSFIKLSSKNQDIFRIQQESDKGSDKGSDVFVSGTHSILYNNEKWMKVSDCPDAILHSNHDDAKKQPFLYCLNTEQKVIPVKGGLKFCDWDEMFYPLFTNTFLRTVTLNDILLYEGFHFPSSKVTYTPAYDYKKYFKTHTLDSIENINEYLDYGFEKGFTLVLKNRMNRGIDKIQVGDVLLGHETVLGTVVIMKNDGTKMYHIITDTSTFTVPNKGMCADYNYCLDKIVGLV